MNTTCRDCKQQFDNTPFMAWGQEVTPVRCKACRGKNTAFRRYNRDQAQRDSRAISSHFASQQHASEIVCTYGDW